MLFNIKYKMKTKTEKNLNMDKNSLVMRNQQKNIPKITSPKNLNLKDHPSWKSEKDLNRPSVKNEEVSINLSKTSSSISSPEIVQTLEKPKLKSGKDQQAKSQIKIVASPKSNAPITSKVGQPARFLRSKNTLTQKEEQKSQKILQQKNEKLEQLQKLNQQLQTKVDILSQQKLKTQQILTQYRSQKQGLEKNLEKLKNVAAENKKLLKEKAESYNNSGSEIKNLRAQLQDLKLTKNNSSTCDIGVNTEVEQPQKFFENLSSPQEKSDQEINQFDTSHQHKTYETQSTTQLYNLISGINVEDSERLAIIKNVYERVIMQKDQKILQRQQIIYQQQCQLNQIYSQKQNKLQYLEPTIDTDEIILLQLKENSNLKNIISLEAEKYYKLMEQNRNQQRQVQTLKRQIKIKQIYYQNDINSYSDLSYNNKMNNKNQLQKLKKQMEDLKRAEAEKLERIQQLEAKNEQQEMIIKNLKEKKPKVIVK